MKTSIVFFIAVFLFSSLVTVNVSFAQALATEKYVTFATPGALTHYKKISAGTGISFSGSYIEIDNDGVTSVGLSLPSIFNVSNSPRTTTGSFAVSLVSQPTPHQVFACPIGGGAGTPVFRGIDSSDVPPLATVLVPIGTSAVTGNLNISGSGTVGGQLQLVGTSSGYSSLQGGAQGATTYNITMPTNLATPSQVFAVLAASGINPIAISTGWNDACDCDFVYNTPMKVEAGQWADWILEPSYHLLPIKEVEKIITTEHHLPDVPTEAEVMKNGMTIGELQSKLLQKIEELTLYLLQLEKRNKDLMARADALEKK